MIIKSGQKCPPLDHAIKFIQCIACNILLMQLNARRCYHIYNCCFIRSNPRANLYSFISQVKLNHYKYHKNSSIAIISHKSMRNVATLDYILGIVSGKIYKLFLNTGVSNSNLYFGRILMKKEFLGTARRKNECTSLNKSQHPINRNFNNN